jgi:drug/metabolite transporter (DMT)-like permease
MPRDPFVATVWEMFAGSAALILAGLARGEARGLDVSTFSGEAWVALAYLITFGSLLAFTAYVWLLHNAPISLVATYAYVNPVVAVILGALLLAEPVTAAILIGGGTVVAGVVAVVTTERPRPVAHEDPSP